MGAIYPVYLGVRIPRSECIKEVKERAFDHDYPEDMSYCPNSGRQLWYDFNQLIGSTDDLDDEKAFGFNVDIGEDNVDVIIGNIIVQVPDHDDYPASACLEDVESVKAALREALEPHGYWNEKSFGIHVTCHC